MLPSLGPVVIPPPIKDFLGTWRVYVNFSHALNSLLVPSISSFKVTVGGVNAPITGIGIGPDTRLNILTNTGGAPPKVVTVEQVALDWHMVDYRGEPVMPWGPLVAA